MYCAYTIPGMTGSSLMYYYNGKAVRQALPSILSISFPSSARVWESDGVGRERERRREREGERGR